MSLDKLRTGDKPSRCLIGEGRREEAGQQPAPPHRSGGVGVGSTSVSSVRESWEISGGGCKTQPPAQAGRASKAGGVAGEVGVLRSSREASVMGVEPRRDTCSRVRSDGGRWLRKEIGRHGACPHQPWPEVPCGNGGTESNPESRIWENRPFGSMRGGRELVIGCNAFQSSLSCLLYRHSSASTLHRVSRKCCGSRPFLQNVAGRKLTKPLSLLGCCGFAATKNKCCGSGPQKDPMFPRVVAVLRVQEGGQGRAERP